MRVPVSLKMQAEPFAAEAAALARSCVHCGFCNATCPTYQLTGNELEGPRGRIYLIKSLLEDGAPGPATYRHLDQCLLCRNCETTCPSGVEYGRLVELVRPQVNRLVGLSPLNAMRRWLVAKVVAHPARLAPLVRLGRAFRGVLPSRVARLVPRVTPLHPAPPRRADQRRVLLLGGCAQAVLNPAIDAAATVVFDAAGIALERCPGADCCGALSHHLGFEADAVRFAKANVDAWWPHLEAGADAVIATSSGCGVHLKDYARLLADEPEYAERARRLQSLVRDPVELLDAAMLRPAVAPTGGAPIAFQAPCTLQHGQRLAGRVETLLRDLGFTLTPVVDGHLCCGSAGSYALFHPRTADALRSDKLAKLMQGAPGEIITANIGCQLHLGAAAAVPVRHWLELLADRIAV